MYESHYGFQEKPFNLTPDPKYLYLSPRHADAFAHLEFGRRERGGFVVITGEVGTGKTTLARYFLGQLGDKTATAVVLYPAVTAAELLRSILDDLKVQPAGASLKDLVDALHAFLLGARRDGREVVLLIDEAQDLSPEVLEQVRLISNLETDTEKLLTIVLMGQSELHEMLARRELRQLAQRVTARYHLAPLSRTETEDYVRHRLEVAGGASKVSFTSGALAGVHRFSGGVPRLVNLVCDRALLAGYVQSARTITEAMVMQAAEEVEGSIPSPTGGRLARGAALAAVVAAALVAGAAWQRAVSVPSPPPAVTAPIRPPASPPATIAPPSPLEPLLRSLPRDASRAAAEAAVSALWNGRSLRQTDLQTHMAQLRRLDLPVVLEMFHPDRRDTCFVALLRLEGDDATVAAGGETLRVAAADLDARWTRQAAFLWSDVEVPGGVDARWAGRAMADLGYAPALGDPKRGVRRFQEDQELEPDGVVGPRTLMTLFTLGPYARPHLTASAQADASAAGGGDGAAEPAG